MPWYRVSRTLTLAAVLVGLAALPAALADDPWTWMASPAGIAVGVRLDLVAALLTTFVGLLGWVVTTYSATNLRGRAQREEVGATLFAALAALLVTVSGGSLVSIGVGWTLSGLAVTVLVSRAGSPDAPRAAKLLRRHLLIGDGFLWTGIIVAALTLPSLERARLDEIDAGWSTTLVALLLLGAAVARTGLVPAHRWLPETAEAPSPVSALLHAGVVNGAGVLVLLTWPLYAAAPTALLVLAVLGAASVVVGIWAGRARADVKGRLACSTTSQMGYMSLQLGLGLPAAALMHLLGHGAYKSWLFLRAGGAVGRTRTLVLPQPLTSARQHGPALLAVTVAGLLSTPALLALVDASGATAMVPVALAMLAAGIAGRAVAGLPRVSLGARWGVSLAGGVLAGGYSWSTLAGEKLMTVALPAAPVWGPTVAALLVAATVLTAVILGIGDRHLARRPDSALAMLMLRTALTPLRRGPGGRGWRASTLPASPTARGLAADGDDAIRVAAVVLAGSLVGPAWPLRHLVAANTLAHLESMSFDLALTTAAKAHGVSGRPSLAYFIDLHDAGRITTTHLVAALAERTPGDQAPAPLFIATTRDLASLPELSPWSERPAQRLCEALPDDCRETVTRLVDEHTALWAQRSWSSAVSADDPGPWTSWRAAASQPAYDRALRLPGAAAVVATLPEDPAAAIGRLAEAVDLPLDRLTGYLIATLVSAPGWSGHAAWRARRAGEPGPLVEWAAVRMAHDVLLSGALGLERPVATTRTPARAARLDHRLREAHAQVWQRALEIGVENWLLPEITARDLAANLHPIAATHRPTTQSLWCIDVRSERVRRHLDSRGEHRTFGYAGFFGAAVDHVDPDAITHERFPALVTASFTAHEHGAALPLRQVLHRTFTSVSRSPLGALVVAEAGGGLAALSSLAATAQPRLLRRAATWWTRGTSRATRPELTIDLGHDARVAMAAAALRSTGLTRDFAPLLIICAHGASPENNAFATAYDCGACGGNDGVVNATLLADALNDPEVRAALADQGLVLPHDTRAVPALHDTTTDVVTLLPTPDLPTDTQQALDRFAEDLRAAGQAAAQERRALLPHTRPRAGKDLARRAADWSEPTPEWGLAGNAATLIGPRALTESTDLAGRVFLHSYDRDTDPEGVVLEQLLTAPLVVTQWINSQYYFSAVAPEAFGAGDKTTHNVVGDVGVLRGAHGDLQTGLPWQALFRHEPGSRPDAESLVHEPVRLLAVVVADPAFVRTIVERHESLRHLVSHEWIRLVCLDRGQPKRLCPDLTWAAWGPVPVEAALSDRPRLQATAEEPRPSASRG